jgi:hypothetical protein
MAKLRIATICLLFLIAGSSCLAAEPTSEQAKAIAEIEKHGGIVRLLDNGPDGPAFAILWRNSSNVTDADLAPLSGLTNIRSLDLQRSNITNAGLEKLKGLTKLQTLILSHTNITGAGLSNLQGMTKLEVLDLSWTRFVNEGLDYIKSLENLRELNLENTASSSRDLKHVAMCKKLKKLELRNNPQITDAGLEYLKDMTQLEYLRVGGNSSVERITPAGVDNLRKALPRAEIISVFIKPIPGLR